MDVSRARKAVPETPSTTPVSITQSLSTLRLEHAHLLEEHGADRATMRQREAELADAQAREVDARATVDTLLQTTRTAEDRAARAERTAALAEREVGFLKALNVRSSFALYLPNVSFPSGKLIHLSQIGELRKRRSLAGSWLHRPGQRAAYQGCRRLGGRVQGPHRRARSRSPRTCKAARTQPGLRFASFT